MDNDLYHKYMYPLIYPGHVFSIKVETSLSAILKNMAVLHANDCA